MSPSWLRLVLTLMAVACSQSSGPGHSTGGFFAGAGGNTGHGGGPGTGGNTGGSTATGGNPATGGSAAGGTAGASATGGRTGTGGASEDAGGSGGTTAAGGRPAGGASGGAASGGVTGRGGTAGGGATSQGGRAAGGRTGTGGAGAGGTTSIGTGGAGGSPLASGDDFVSDVKIAVDSNAKTILVVTWTQLQAADKTLLEFSFAGSDVMKSRAQAGATGAHRDVVLGVPEKTDVTVRIVSQQGGVDYKTKSYTSTTGAIPSGMPRPTLVSYDAALASPEQWLLGSVEDSTGGCAEELSCYYNGVFWLFIMDRQARIVWYWADPSSNTSSAYPRVARDGEYIVFDKGGAGGDFRGAKGVIRMTLDRRYYELISFPDVDDAIDVTSDGSILYDTNGELHEYTRQGTNRTIWSCSAHLASGLNCYSNTVNWVPADDTVLLSFPYISTVVQIDRKTGNLVGQYGNASGSYAFSPSPWKFQFQHSPTITPEGTLLVSSHLPDYPDGTKAAPQHHAFEEFTIDRTSKKLTQKWIYSDGTEWAGFKGYNLRLANGNTLANYGTGGVICEITPDKKRVFQVKFDVATGDDYYNKMVGNTVLVSDLYALNGGGPK